MRWFLRAPPCIEVRGGASSVTIRPFNKRPSQTHSSPSLTMWRRVIDDVPILRTRLLVAILAVDGGHVVVDYGWRSSTVVAGVKLSRPRLYISHRDPYAVLAHHHMSPSANCPFRTVYSTALGYSAPLRLYRLQPELLLCARGRRDLRAGDARVV